jgi:hypothetical protein
MRRYLYSNVAPIKTSTRLDRRDKVITHSILASLSSTQILKLEIINRGLIL